MPKIAVPRGWNKRVQTGILQAISLGRHCFVSIVARMAKSPKASERLVAENEHLRFEVASLREELRLKDARMARYPPSVALTTPPLNACRFWSCVLPEAGIWHKPQTDFS
jgi:hypothetical protein